MMILRLLALWLGFLLLTSGCRFINPQEDVELKLARQLTPLLKVYEIVSTNTPVTNMYQILSDSYPHLGQHFYPQAAHQQLLDFGKHAGFKTSIVEKYTFFSPRLTNSDLYGEAVCMTKPFRNMRGQLSRLYIAKRGDVYGYSIITEDRMQRILRESNPSIQPLPAIQPPPPIPPEWRRTLPRRYTEFVWNLSGALGQDSPTLGHVIVVTALTVSLCGLTFFCTFSIRRGRRRAGLPERGAAADTH